MIQIKRYDINNSFDQFQIGEDGIFNYRSDEIIEAVGTVVSFGVIPETSTPYMEVKFSDRNRKYILMSNELKRENNQYI